MLKSIFVSLKEVRLTTTPDTYEAIVDFDLIDPTTGEIVEAVYDASYGVVPGDTSGIALQVRTAVQDWIDAGNPIVPYTPPTPEEIRASMPPLSMRQLRLGLIANGIALASVQAAVDAITDPTAREVAQVEWEYSDTVERSHLLISQIGAALNLTPEAIDTMWEASLAL